MNIMNQMYTINSVTLDDNGHPDTKSIESIRQSLMAQTHLIQEKVRAHNQ